MNLAVNQALASLRAPAAEVAVEALRGLPVDQGAMSANDLLSHLPPFSAEDESATPSDGEVVVRIIVEQRTQ